MAPFDVSAAGVARGAGECPFLWKAGCVGQLRDGGHARPATPSQSAAGERRDVAGKSRPHTPCDLLPIIVACRH